MYVWIPRYAYKIESGYHTDQVGEISVKFLNTDNTYKDGSSTRELLTDLNNNTKTSATNYIVHPAFTWAKEDGTKVELEGIWIGKFEASSADASYAATYLAHSKYGRNRITDETMTNTTGYNTGNGNYKTNVQLSTTGNVYGIYDMAGGAWEHVAAYVDSTKGGTVANQYLTSETYGKALYDAAAKYKDVYVVKGEDEYTRNYAANAHVYGDGIYETSSAVGTWISGTGNVGYYNNSWNQDYSLFPFSGRPFFSRGGYYADGVHAGVFAFGHSAGLLYSHNGFRSVLATL